MADIELVIKIPETLKRITDEEDYRAFSHPVWLAILMESIQNGIPLPKGHGRLIDADKFISEHFGKVARLVDDAPTIIEVDKGDKE